MNMVFKYVFNSPPNVPYPPQRLRTISPSPGLFPYIKRYVLKTLAVKNSPPMTDIASTPKLTAICQAGISVIPSLSITMVGAVSGKMLRTIHTGF